MKPKKKNCVPTKKAPKKTTTPKPLMLISKTVATTKERTHNTIQEPVQIRDTKLFPQSARNHRPRLSCLQRLEDYNLSPFSSPGGSSFSPQLRKTLSPSLKDEKEKKKNKTKVVTTQEKYTEKKKQEAEKKEAKVKTKMTKEECNHAYQTLLMQKLKEKKITQMSQESSNSVPKLNKLKLKHRLPKDSKRDSVDKQKYARIKDLKRKIQEKYRRQLPSLKRAELNFFCSIVLIQRLWQQRKIKKIINDFMSPRAAIECNFTGVLSRENNACRLDMTVTTQQQTSELIKKYHNISNFSDKKREVQPESHSTEIETTKKKINLKDLELQEESQLSDQKQEKMVHFVECLRDISFHKAPKSKKMSRRNVFNLQESFSEKCLMQTFYQRVFKDSSTKMNNFQLFKIKNDEKTLERSIQLIHTIESPQKQEVIMMEERFETQLQSKDHIEESKVPLIETAQVSIATDESLEHSGNIKQISSIKQLNNLSQEILKLVLGEFCQEFDSFKHRKVLKKQKKSTLPGLRASSNTIKQYLQGLTGYMMGKYQQEVVRRFKMINPMSFLKIHHEYDEEDEYYEQEEDEQMNLPIVPHTLFYEYQQVYEGQKFIVPESEKKFTNFLEGLIKIHNLLLANCLSELLQKARIQRIILPWDQKLDLNRNSDFSRKNLEKLLNGIIDNICGCAFMRVGQLHRRCEDLGQEQRLLKSIRMQLKTEGNDWSAQYEYLELRMDLTKYVEEMILQEVMRDLEVFI